MAKSKPAAEDAAAPEVAVADAPEPSLLDQIIASTRPQTEEDAVRSRDYFQQFISTLVAPGTVITPDVEVTVKNWIAQIDQTLTDQLNEVIHTPEFQKLESTWRGLHYLVHQSETGERLKIRVLNLPKRELYKDLERAIEFDQSQLFRKIYEEEYGMLGGEPYGMLVGDYEFGRHPEDIGLLKMMSGVAAMAHAPFVAAVSPKMMGFDEFTELGNPRDLAKIFSSVEYAAWKSFRESEDSRYVALTMPRVLSRLPYGEKFKTIDEFKFEEDVDGRTHRNYSWMSSAWAYAARVTDAFAQYGWFARTRGVEGGGKIEGLPVHTFPTDDGDVAMKCPSEIAITDRREFELSNLGFMPLIHCKNRDFSVFMGGQSCQKPTVYLNPAATANAELSAKFNLMLCTSRFAHYLKVMARNKIGSTMDVGSCRSWLNTWIGQYIINPSSASDELLAKYPLSDARVDVREVPGKPGWFEAVAYIKPHYQFETLTASVRMVAEIPK